MAVSFKYGWFNELWIGKFWKPAVLQTFLTCFVSKGVNSSYPPDLKITCTLWDILGMVSNFFTLVELPLYKSKNESKKFIPVSES